MAEILTEEWKKTELTEIMNIMIEVMIGWTDTSSEKTEKFTEMMELIKIMTVITEI